MSKVASLLTNLTNIEYLTGFKSSNAVLLQTTTHDYLFTDGRYLEKAQKIATLGRGRIGKFTVIDMGRNFQETLKNLLKKHRVKTLEFEAGNLTVKQFETYKKWTRGARGMKAVSWKPGAADVWAQRACKEISEIQALKKSQEINEQLFYSALKELKPGITELDLAQFIKQTCYTHGADDISFEPIIAFGNHSSMPHHQNTNRRLKKGDLVLIDMGVKYKRYCSDMTRMVFTASPTPKQAQIYELVLKAQEAGIQAMKPGVSGKNPDTAARKIFKNAKDLKDPNKWEDKFTHSLGHGIGLEVHEPPTLSQHSRDKLKPGIVVTSEPGLYLPGEFGVRIEDMILITKSGRQNLTHAPKQLRDCILR